eukprot:516348_1
MNLELFAEFKNVSNVSNCSCSVDGEVFIHYAYDGVHYELLGNSNHVSINLHQVSHLSRIHFNVTNIPTANMGLNCEIYVNGATYKTSNPETYWNIIKVQSGGTDIYQHGESIWNSNNVTKLNSVVFEFSFQNVLGSEYIAINVGDLLTIENKTTVQWDPHLDREKCKTIDYWDGISRNLRVNCHGSSTGTFEHLKDIDTFSISFTPHMVSEYGITDIQLYYGLCYDVLPLIWHSVRYNNNYYPLTDELMHSLTNDYIFMMIQCELDTYESSETFIKLGSIDNSNNAFVVQIKKNTISILDKSNNTVNHTTISGTYAPQTNLINNTEWFEMYIEWNKNENYFRVGTGYTIEKNVLIQVDYYEIYSVFPGGNLTDIDYVSIKHSSSSNKNVSDGDWNIINFQFIDTNQPKLCWTNAEERIAVKSWINTDMKTIWLYGDSSKNEPAVRIPTELSNKLIFNGPFIGGDVISKSLTSIYKHDYIHLQAKVYGLGDFDVIYPVWLNGLSIFFNESDYGDSLIWFGTFLSDGGISNKQCNIEEYKQWFNWTELTSNSGLPIDILTTNSCYYDIDIYLKHNTTHEPFSISFIGNLDQSKCDATPQFDIQLVDELENANTTINGYPKSVNVTVLTDNSYKKCAYWCDIHKDCKAWMYNATGYCWLKKTSDLNIIKTGGYISGICISEYIYDDNTTCINEHTLIKHGYKTDITDYFINHALINYDQAIINCVTDSMHLINITVSHNNGITFPINVGSQVSKISKNISNLTYASKIKFDVSEVRYNISLDKNGYYGFEAIGHPSYFISQCGNNIYLTNFTRRQNRTISSYQWQIVSPGLNGDDGTISILGSYYIGNEKYETYVTVTDNTQQATDIESTRLTLPPIHRYVFNNNGLKEGEIHIACVADDALVVHYAKDGTTYGASIGDVSFGVPLLLNISDVTAASKLRFSVTNSGGTSNNGAGLRCSIYSHVAVVSTSNNSSFWSVNASRGNDTIVYVWSGLRSIADTVSESNGEFIWNTNCTGLEATTPVACVGTTVVFQFEFTNMKLYHYNMSTFKLVPCTTPGYTQSAFAIEGVGEYSNNYFVINDQIKPTNVAGKCSLYSSPESDILLANTFAPNTFMCWYIRSANPTGLGCTIDINKTIYVTSDDTMYWNVGNIETDSKYLNAELNLTQHGGRWIWNQPCLPINNTECINSNSAEFTFSLNNISTYPTYTDCESQCYEYAECDGWVYRTPNHSRIEPECYLSYDLPIDLIEDQDYTTGFVVIQNQCHCICGDCYPGNEYHYIYLNDSTRFDNPLFMG